MRVGSRATDRIDPSQSCAKDQICLKATDPMDNAMTAERRSRVDPKNRLKLAGAIDKNQCGIGSPTWARTRDLRINSPSLYQLSYRGNDADEASNYSFSAQIGSTQPALRYWFRPLPAL